MILFSGGNLGVLYLSGSFIPLPLVKLAHLNVHTRAFVIEITGSLIV